MIMNRVSNLLKRSWNPIKIAVRNHPYPMSFKHFLENCHPGPEYSEMQNGLLVATEERALSPNATVALYLDAGSRYESAFENGIAHFFEHIAYRGTNRRTQACLEAEMTALGADFKCFTTREMVGYYVQCLSHQVPCVVELLADCVFNNSLCTPIIEAQKKTVYAEMMKQDLDTNDVLYDYLHASAFQGTPLGYTVMGPSTNLYNFNSCTLANYLNKYFNPIRTVLVAVGGVKHSQMEYLANSYLSHFEPCKCAETNFYRYTGSEVRYRDDSQPLGNVIFAVEGPNWCDDDRLVMEIAREAIGSWDRSQISGRNHPFKLAHGSKLNRCDAYKSFNIPYKETGLWGIQFIGHVMGLDDICWQITDQWMKLTHCITEAEVDRAKRILKTKYLSSMQSSRKVCYDIGRWTLYSGRRPPVLETINAIEAVTAADVREVCKFYIDNKCPTVVAVGKTEGLGEYNRIRGGMYWLRV